MWELVDTVVVVVIFSFFFSFVNIVNGVFDDVQTVWLFWADTIFGELLTKKYLVCGLNVW